MFRPQAAKSRVTENLRGPTRFHSTVIWVIAFIVGAWIAGPIHANTNDFSGDWNGSWTSYSGPGGGLSASITQTGTDLNGTLSLTATDCGNLYNLPLTGEVFGGNQASFYTYTYCDGSYSELEFTNGALVNNEINGNYTVYDEGIYYDGGTFSVTRGVNLINASSGTGGSIVPSGLQFVTAGTSVSFTITPDSGYRISDVVVDGASVGVQTSYTFTNVSANHVISAAFETIPEYTITSSAGEGGTIFPVGALVVDEGASQIFTITPEPGFIIADVLVDGVSVGAVSTFTIDDVQADRSIVASFRLGIAPLLPVLDLLLE